MTAILTACRGEKFTLGSGPRPQSPGPEPNRNSLGGLFWKPELNQPQREPLSPSRESRVHSRFTSPSGEIRTPERTAARLNISKRQREPFIARVRIPRTGPAKSQTLLTSTVRNLRVTNRPRTHQAPLQHMPKTSMCSGKIHLARPSRIKERVTTFGHIRELFGDMPLDDLRPDDIKRAYADARSNGRFSDAEIRRIHVKLKQVMQDALENELLVEIPV